MQTFGVVVVDDQQAYRQVVAEVIDAVKGFTLLGSLADPGSLGEVMETLHPDLVMLDVRMPHVDGSRLAVRLRADHPEVTVLLMSVFGSDDIPADVFDAGVRFVEKENLDADLLQGLRPLIARRKAGKE